MHNNHTRLSIRGIQTQISLRILENTQLIVAAHMMSMYEFECETKKSNRKGEEIKGIEAKTGNMDAGNANKVFFLSDGSIWFLLSAQHTDSFSIEMLSFSRKWELVLMDEIDFIWLEIYKIVSFLFHSITRKSKYGFICLPNSKEFHRLFHWMSLILKAANFLAADLFVGKLHN